MDLPGRPVRTTGASRAPASGVKMMLAILVVFALLAAYGQWERSRRSRIETLNIIPARSVSPTPSPNNH